MRQVFQSIVDAVSGSNWSYLIVFAIAMLDAFFPIVPSEATAIAAGVVAVSYKQKRSHETPEHLV
jgi:membrane-associated protein